MSPGPEGNGEDQGIRPASPRATGHDNTTTAEPGQVAHEPDSIRHTRMSACALESVRGAPPYPEAFTCALAWPNSGNRLRNVPLPLVAWTHRLKGMMAGETRRKFDQDFREGAVRARLI